MKFRELSEWIELEFGCATRIVVSGDVNNIADRVAFIEKSPRVRISKNKLCVEREPGIPGCTAANRDAWLYGNKGTGGADTESRKWCDDVLRLLGWE